MIRENDMEQDGRAVDQDVPGLDGAGLEIGSVLTTPRFTEHHSRVVAKPIEAVWPHCRQVPADEIRLLGPLMKLRNLPRLVRGRRAITVDEPRPLIDAFLAEGFHLLRCDQTPDDGRAVILFGAVGRFWSPSDNAPIRFERTEEFLAFEEPGYAKMVANLTARDLGNGTTRIETATRVAGTDGAANAKFGPYWAVIRGPSGLIRRSWLAAIDRRVHRAISP